VDIVLIRHGAEANSKKLDEKTPLSEEGQKQVGRLKDTLKLMKLQPEVFLTSCGYRRVEETAECLSVGTAKSVPIEALNPLDQTHLTHANILENIMSQANAAHVDLYTNNSVALVGHGPVLNLILTCLTSQRVRCLDRSEAVWVRADTMDDFLRGKGEIYCRIPVADYQEETLRTKVQSKMTVSTLLAGFVFAVLADLLKVPGANMTLLQIVTILLLTAALALFIASVYIYDQLAMPEGFWSYDSDGGRRILFWRIRIPESWRGKHFEVDRHERGPLYAYMVWTWGRIFTLGVLFGIVSFILMLFSTGRKEVIAGGIVVLVMTALVYWFVRPRLSTD
jgi:phosphohistidine phosphatase SixA